MGVRTGDRRMLSSFLILRLVTGLGDKREKALVRFIKQNHTFPGRKKEILKNTSFSTHAWNFLHPNTQN